MEVSSKLSSWPRYLWDPPVPVFLPHSHFSTQKGCLPLLPPTLHHPHHDIAFCQYFALIDDMK